MAKLTLPSPSLQIYVNPRDQQRAELLLKRCPEIMRKAYDKSTQRFAKIVLRIIRESFMTGLPPIGGGVSWKPLSPKTLKIYRYWHYENAHPWYLIGQMAKRVGIYKARTKNKETIIGFPQGVRAINPNPKQRNSSLLSRPTLNALAAVLEGGGNKIPPRPLFRPAFKAAGGKNRLVKFYIEDLKKELRKYMK